MEFTIGETLSYFGHLMRMNTIDISNRTTFLVQLLNLPEKSRLIKRLRYSFCKIQLCVIRVMVLTEIANM